MRRCCLIHLKNSSTCRRAGGALRRDGFGRARGWCPPASCWVGEEDERLAGAGVLEANPPEMLGVMLRCLDAGERDYLIADDAGRAIGRRGGGGLCVHVRLGPRDGESTRLMQRVEPGKISPRFREGRLHRGS